MGKAPAWLMVTWDLGSELLEAELSLATDGMVRLGFGSESTYCDVDQLDELIEFLQLVRNAAANEVDL